MWFCGTNQELPPQPSPDNSPAILHVSSYYLEPLNPNAQCSGPNHTFSVFSGDHQTTDLGNRTPEHMASPSWYPEAFPQLLKSPSPCPSPALLPAPLLTFLCPVKNKERWCMEPPLRPSSFLRVRGEGMAQVEVVPSPSEQCKVVSEEKQGPRVSCSRLPSLCVPQRVLHTQ